MFDPAHREDYVDYLEAEGQWEEAAKQLGICVNDEDFLSPHVRCVRLQAFSCSVSIVCSPERAAPVFFGCAPVALDSRATNLCR